MFFFVLISVLFLLNGFFSKCRKGNAYFVFNLRSAFIGIISFLLNIGKEMYSFHCLFYLISVHSFFLLF